MNQVNLVGRMVQTPELKILSDGNQMTKFNVAISRYLGFSQEQEKKNEGKATADFPRIVAWGKTAENCSKYLTKGSKVSVTGRIVTGQFQNEAGETLYTTEIVAERIKFLDSASDS